MRIPVWLTLGIAALVIGFGLFRLRLGLRSADDQAGGQQRGGFYGMSRRIHLLIGGVYLLLGFALVATSFGWNPFGGLFGPDTEVPTKDKAPTSVRLPIDQLPPPKQTK